MIREHDGEPVHGLPARLPAGETILWQGAPDWWLLARRAFHLQLVAVYFVVLAGWRGIATIYDGGTIADAAFRVGVLAVVAGLAVALFMVLAYAMARSTVYTLTNRRIVMRIGAALSMTINLPFAAIDAASVKPLAKGHGDIAIKTHGKHRLGYLVLWPHARPWRLARPEPTLRAIPDVERVAALFADAFATATSDRVVRGEAPAGDSGPAIAGLAPAAG